MDSEDGRKAEIIAMIEKMEEETPMTAFSDKEQWMPPFYKKIQQYLNRENKSRGISITIEIFD